jgi:hypothetical protein
MAIDKEEIKKALDSFEEDDFVTSKETLKDEIRKVKNAYIKDKLGLKNDVEPAPEEETEETEDDSTDNKEEE